MPLGFSSDARKRRTKEQKSSRLGSNAQPRYPTPCPQNVAAPPARSTPQCVPQRPYHGQPYLAASSTHLAPKSTSNLRDTFATQAGKSVTQLASKTSQYLDPHRSSCQVLNQGAALCDRISSKLDAILTSMDEERFSGKEQDLYLPEPFSPPESYLDANSQAVHRGLSAGLSPNQAYASPTDRKGSNHFSKVWLYANSRLPPHLPPFKVYLPTWPLLCLAATYSERVYSPTALPHPNDSSEIHHVPADWRSGTKAMVLKSVIDDNMHTIVFSIRGSATFMDWAVNYKSAPSPPKNFLDDQGNLCHSGFLYVAKKMVAPVAERLRTLLEENPSRSHCSLLITGHSAGGAVAALLYAHMMSTAVQSELTYLTGFFKRVHCVTFGAPPVSLLPLQKPSDRRHRKSLFFSIINEGDPVPRADKQVIRSLLRLYGSPAPSSSLCTATLVSLSKLNLSSTSPSNTSIPTTSSSRPSLGAARKKTKSISNFSKFRKNSHSSASASAVPTTTTTATTTSTQPTWTLPTTTLSAAGRLVVIRDRPGTHPNAEDIEAMTIDDQLLRTVVYGDPLKHMMSLYKRRVDILATRAVTAGNH